MRCVLCGYRDTIDGMPNPETHTAYLRARNGWCRVTTDGHHRRANNFRAEKPQDQCAACGTPLRAQTA